MSYLEARTKVLAMSTSPETVVQKEPANLKEARLKKAEVTGRSSEWQPGARGWLRQEEERIQVDL